MGKKVVVSGSTDSRQLKVGDLEITDEFKTIDVAAMGKEAAKKLMGIPRGVVLVIDEEDKPAGVVTAREFLIKIVNGDNPTKMAVNKIMNTNILQLQETMLLDDAVPEVTTKDPYAVVVTDKVGKFKGYFSPMDYQEALARINYQRNV
jgi:predicted transcriptional regulator